MYCTPLTQLFVVTMIILLPERNQRICLAYWQSVYFLQWLPTPHSPGGGKTSANHNIRTRKHFQKLALMLKIHSCEQVGWATCPPHFPTHPRTTLLSSQDEPTPISSFSGRKRLHADVPPVWSILIRVRTAFLLFLVRC